MPDPDGIRSEPQPDVVVLRNESSAEYFHRHPSPADIDLVVEVADTSVDFDRELKAPLYARCGIPQYWIIDIPRCRMIEMLNPGPAKYKSVLMHDATEIVTFRGCSIGLAELFAK